MVFSELAESLAELSEGSGIALLECDGSAFRLGYGNRSPSGRERRLWLALVTDPKLRCFTMFLTDSLGLEGRSYGGLCFSEYVFRVWLLEWGEIKKIDHRFALEGILEKKSLGKPSLSARRRFFCS